MTTAAPAIDAGIQIKKKSKKKQHGSPTTILIISNEEMNDILKFVKSL